MSKKRSVLRMSHGLGVDNLAKAVHEQEAKRIANVARFTSGQFGESQTRRESEAFLMICTMVCDTIGRGILKFTEEYILKTKNIATIYAILAAALYAINVPL